MSIFDRNVFFPLAVGELGVLHAREQIQALLDRAIAERAVFAGLCRARRDTLRFLGRRSQT